MSEWVYEVEYFLDRIGESDTEAWALIDGIKNQDEAFRRCDNLVALLRQLYKRKYGGRGVDDGGVHDGSFRESQPLLLEMCVDLLKDALSQAVGFEKVTEFADGGLVGDGFVPEVDSDEAPH